MPEHQPASGPTWPELGGRRVVGTCAGFGMGLTAIELSVATGASVLGATQSDRGLAAVEAAGADTLRGLTPDEYHAQRIAATPMRRAGTPQEAAQLFAFLCRRGRHASPVSASTSRVAS